MARTIHHVIDDAAEYGGDCIMRRLRKRGTNAEQLLLRMVGIHTAIDKRYRRFV
jgi:hypothetical protein